MFHVFMISTQKVTEDATGALITHGAHTQDSVGTRT